LQFFVERFDDYESVRDARCAMRHACCLHLALQYMPSARLGVNGSPQRWHGRSCSALLGGLGACVTDST
jgi:hypothetical protein